MFKKILNTILPKKMRKGFQPQAKKYSVKEHGIKKHLLCDQACHVVSTLQNKGFKAFIVGGAVRDLLLDIAPKDFDVATNATPEQVKKLFRRAFIIGRRFRIVHVLLDGELIEVTTFRGGDHQDTSKDEHGRILHDNTFGMQHQDAQRRDFTINAMYYDPSTETLFDYHQGIDDIKNRTIRIIGQAEQRYREDPVRMLRAVRFAAKLEFTLDEQTQAPIKKMAGLVTNIPASRLLDEMLKLLMCGHAMACLQQLRQQGLHNGLLPVLDIVLEQPLGERFITLALNETDERIKAGKSTSVSFLLATLLWHQVLQLWQQQQKDLPAIPALHAAIDSVFDMQAEKIALQRKITADIREIWAMQPRFEKRSPRAVYSLLNHPRFKAGYDFLLLRDQAKEVDHELVSWWKAFLHAEQNLREELLQQALTPNNQKPRKRKRKPKRNQSDSDAPASNHDE